jgi:hypothetical protein
LTAHLTKGRQISSPQVRRSHNPSFCAFVVAEPSLLQIERLPIRAVMLLSSLAGADEILQYCGICCGI